MRSYRFAAAIAFAVAVAGCGKVIPALAPPQSSTSQVAVQAMQQEYLDQFLTPATAYAISPHCPQPAGQPCSDPAVIAKLQAAQIAARKTLDAAQNFTDAAPGADATGPLASARQALTAAEAALPGAN